MVTYERLWNYLKKLNLNPSDLSPLCGISYSTLARMRQNKAVSLDVIDRICLELDCPIETVVEIKRPKED